MEVQGKLLSKTEIISIGDKGFTKREFVIETGEQYPQKIILELIKDKCSLIDSFNVGDEISASINLRGREWINPEGVAKYFNTLVAWKISLVTEGSGASQSNDAPPFS